LLCSFSHCCRSALSLESHEIERARRASPADSQVALSLQAAVSDLERHLIGTETKLQSLAQTQSLIDAIGAGNNRAIARQLDANTTVTIAGVTIGRKTPVALTRSLNVDIGNRFIARISRTLSLTPAVLMQIGQPLPVKGTTFSVVDRNGRIVVGSPRGAPLAPSGTATLAGNPSRTFGTTLGQNGYRLQVLVPAHHLQQMIAKQADETAVHRRPHRPRCAGAVPAASARAVGRNLRESDVLARVGGEEFAVLLPNTIEEGAVELADRLRAALLASNPLVTDVDSQITASFGAIQLDRDANDETASVVSPPPTPPFIARSGSGETESSPPVESRPPGPTL
jgi:Diguanylate cyclase, GGDEF domain